VLLVKKNAFFCKNAGLALKKAGIHGIIKWLIMNMRNIRSEKGVKHG